jgi:hypothetical protein
MSFPGSQMTTSGTTTSIPASWMVMILPSLDRMDIFEYWKTACTPSATNTNPKPPTIKPLLEIGVCPNNKPADTSSGQWLAYRVNTGRYGMNSLTIKSPASVSSPRTGTQVVSEGVCSDQFNKAAGPSNGIFRVGLSNLKDGAANTLLLAERSASSETLAKPWEVTSKERQPQAYFGSAEDANGLGFNWAFMNNLDPNKDQTNIPSKINSNHPGLVIVGFCDSHSRTLRSDCDRLVYMQLMAPYDSDAGEYDTSNPPRAGIRNPASTKEIVPPLDESKIE